MRLRRRLQALAWLLGLGGGAASVLIAPLVLGMGLLLPLGWPLAPAESQSWLEEALASPAVRAGLALLHALVFWHAAFLARTWLLSRSARPLRGLGSLSYSFAGVGSAWCFWVLIVS